jgi:hypothetical protein
VNLTSDGVIRARGGTLGGRRQQTERSSPAARAIKTRAAAEKGIESVKHNAADAAVVDNTA